MFQTMKMLAVAGVVAGVAALASPVRADHIGLSVGMGVNVGAGRTTTFINPSPVVYVVPQVAGPVYFAPGYAAGGYYAAPDCVAPLYSQAFSGPSFGLDQTFYQPNFYYGGGFYQTGGISASPFLYGGRRFYGGGAYGGGYGIASQGYRTAPVWAGPSYNGMPSRLTFGPLSRW